MAIMSAQLLEDALNVSEPIIKDITEPCDFCVELIKLMVKTPPNDIGAMYGMRDFRPGYGPESCGLCEMISREWSVTPAYLRNCIMTGWHLSRRHSSEQNRITGSAIGSHTFNMWADRGKNHNISLAALLLTRASGTPACATLIDRPPILGSHMNKVADLVQYWRNWCSTHKRCLPEEATAMPTRVLALCGDDKQPSIQLTESGGLEGRYLALSYCWGLPKRRPLRTTVENFKMHQDGIAFEDLPKTFQDVVELAQAIGIKYVWIDSLCIIQGDSQDWHSEAARMRDVYRNATLVVAASCARDSSEGLFITDRPAATVLRLPYRVDGKCNGTFNMMHSAQESNWNPRYGALERRAWALQERYLARRMIAFMPQGVTWHCQTTTANEYGQSFFCFGQEIWWSFLLREYTRRSLTFPSDRIEALRGIANEIQRSREDRYVAEYGVWEDDLEFQLLWINRGPCFDGSTLSDMPSWSWAATESAKRWPSENTDPRWGSTRGAEKMSGRIKITTAGHLQIYGCLSTTQTTPSYVRDKFTERDLKHDELRDLCNSWDRERDEFSILTHDTNGGYDRTVLGVAQFDNDRVTTYTHACFLAKQTDRSEELGHGQGKRFVKREYIDDVVYHTEQNPTFVYWALLLERVDRSNFRRVGIATLLPVAHKAFQVEVQEFKII